MAVSYKTVGSTSTGSTQLLPGYPSGVDTPSENEFLIIGVTNKLDSHLPNAITGWTNLGSYTGGAGSAGAASGPTRITALAKISAGGESGTVTVDIPSGNSAVGKMYSFTIPAGYKWRSFVTGGVNVTGSTNTYTVVSQDEIKTQPGDMIVVITSVNTNAYNYTTPTVTQTGATITNDAFSKKVDTGTGTGNDSEQVGSIHPVTDGHGTGFLTMTMTSSGNTSASPTGASIFIVLRPHKRRIFRQSAKVVRELPVPSGIVEWNPATVTEPVYASMAQGAYFWFNPQGVGLRNAFHYSPTNYSLPTVGGVKRFRCHVEPRLNAVGSSYHYRAEVTRDWESGMDLGTREGLAFGLDIPVGGLKNHGHDIDFMQLHAGSYPGESSNDPVLYLALAPSGVEDDNDDVSQVNEIVVVNKVRDAEQSLNPQISGRINTGIVVANGERHDFVLDFTSGINGTGSITLWHCLEGGDWSIIYQAIESLAWANSTDGGSNPNVHPDWKLGIYCPALRSLSGVQAAEALNGGEGTYSIILDFVGVRNIYLPVSHPFYNKSILGSIKTTDMP